MLGYDLLWVQPLAIILGYFVLAAVAKQTTHTGERAYEAFWNRLHPALAILWGVSAMVATILWHIPQYSLTANGIIVLLGGGEAFDARIPRLTIGIVVLAAACMVVYMYNSGSRGLKLYELAVKLLVWGIVLAFAIVAFSTGVDFNRLFQGLTGISFLRDWVFGAGVPQATVVPIVGGIAAAVGINMVFLYPYSLLNKKWGKEYKELAYFDLMLGMVIPFLIATTLMMVAVANTIGPDAGMQGNSVKDIREILPVLETTLGKTLSLVLIGFGMTAIGFSTIITHMLAAGFIGCELFGVKHDGQARWLFSLLPAIGIIGVLIPFPWFAAVTASSLAACLMPIAVMGFIVLLNQRSYMGSETPTGAMRWFWNTVLIFAVVVISIASVQGLRGNWDTLKEHLTPTETEASS
jgi:Mn2+/Fe2+ NRAMP family transporter